MIYTSASLAASGIAAKKLIESITADLYATAKSEVGSQIKKWRASNRADVVWKRVRQLRLVKTIWQMEKEVDLATFYHPATILVGKTRKAIHEVSAFQHDGSILIEGTVGQGKSILLRYLASTDVFISKRIPVFVELRRLRAGNTLVSLALEELKALGFEMTNELFHFFASKGKLTLFLDAFDEVKEELRGDAIAELETLLRRHDRLQAVVTSRPDSGIESSALLRVFKLGLLQGNEYEDVIRKITHDQRIAEQIITGIGKVPNGLAKVLDTPLMVALLVVRYRIDQSLPENESAFYQALFILLLQRHDKAKGGYIRPRKSGLSDGVLLDFFNALSFVTRKAGETSFSPAQLNKFARDALAAIGKTADLDRVLSDIIEISCLIISDGQECKFIHKSVQEYHAALFISEQPDDSARTFYAAMTNRWRQWMQELEFLVLIDRYRFFRDFHIPLVRSLLEIDGIIPTDWTPSHDIIIKIFGKDRLGFNDKAACSVAYISSSRYWATGRMLVSNTTYARKLLRISRDLVAGPDEPGEKLVTRSINSLLCQSSCQKIVENACGELLGRVVEDLREAESFVRSVESRKSVLSF